MRRLLLILLAVPTVALAADAGGNPPATPPATAAQGAASPANPSQPPAPPMSPAVAPDSTDCRMSCAQANYFCRAANDESDCSPAWSRCVAACVSPNLDPTASTAP